MKKIYLFLFLFLLVLGGFLVWELFDIEGSRVISLKEITGMSLLEVSEKYPDSVMRTTDSGSILQLNLEGGQLTLIARGENDNPDLTMFELMKTCSNNEKSVSKRDILKSIGYPRYIWGWNVSYSSLVEGVLSDTDVNGQTFYYSDYKELFGENVISVFCRDDSTVVITVQKESNIEQALDIPSGSLKETLENL